MSDEAIKALNEQVQRLNKEAAQRRVKNRDLSARVADLARQLDEATKARDEWKTRAETPADGSARIAELEGELRTIRHKAAFSAAVKSHAQKAKATVEEPAIEALWAVSGYKPEGDPDEASLAELVGTLATGHAYAFKQGGQAPPTELPPGPGARRGAPATAEPGAGAVVVRRSDIQDYAYMMRNSQRIAEAEKAGNLIITDE